MILQYNILCLSLGNSSFFNLTHVAFWKWFELNWKKVCRVSKEHVQGDSYSTKARLADFTYE